MAHNEDLRKTKKEILAHLLACLINNQNDRNTEDYTTCCAVCLIFNEEGSKENQAIKINQIIATSNANSQLLEQRLENILSDDEDNALSHKYSNLDAEVESLLEQVVDSSYPNIKNDLQKLRNNQQSEKMSKYENYISILKSIIFKDVAEDVSEDVIKDVYKFYKSNMHFLDSIILFFWNYRVFHKVKYDFDFTDVDIQIIPHDGSHCETNLVNYLISNPSIQTEKLSNISTSNPNNLHYLDKIDIDENIHILKEFKISDETIEKLNEMKYTLKDMKDKKYDDDNDVYDDYNDYDDYDDLTTPSEHDYSATSKQKKGGKEKRKSKS